MSARSPKTIPAQKAVIYCRVSSAKQVAEGHGLQSQESRCREYARARGYAVADIFYEEGVSGSRLDRPGLMAMIAYLKLQDDPNGTVVIIDDINRFSRDISVHWQLRALVAEAGGKLQSPSLEFGEDSDSRLIENMLASVAQHQREKNTEQVKNRMRARVMAGYWLFSPVLGYRYENVAGHGKMMVRDEPLASIIQEALEGYASARYESVSEVKRFLESRPEFPKDTPQGEVRFQRVLRLLQKPQYAGYLEVKKWDIPLMKAQHEGLISLATWETIQRRQKENAKAPARADLSEDFVLRGFVLCAHCERPMTASWSKSRSGKRHPYYHCYYRGCTGGRPSVRRDELEGAFGELLKSVTPAPPVIAIAKAMFKHAWEQRGAQAEQIRRAHKARIVAAERQIGTLLDKIIESSSPRVVAAYEERIETLEREKLLAAEQLETTGKPVRPFGEMFEHALGFLANPYKLWEKGDLAVRRTVLRLTFASRITYCKNQGVRTADLALPFKALRDFTARSEQMVEPRGIEPLTFALRTRRSPS